jgi:uncharacterized protein (DUF58 family)
MRLLPSRRLVQWAAVVAVTAFAVVAFPRAWLLLLAFDLVLALAALLDLLLMPGPEAIDALRLSADQMSVLEDQIVTLCIRNRARVALWVRLRDSIPSGFQSGTEEVSGEVSAGGEARWHYRLKPLKRGLFIWGPIQLRYRSLLGLWERQKTVPAAEEVRVYPNLASLYRYHLLARADRLAPLGIRRLRLRGSAWEFESLRDYARGDDVRLIDWKATARRRKFIVRNQEAERNQTVLLLIDSGRLMTAEVEGVAKLDHAVNTALTLAHVALSRGDRVGLCTFSHRVHAWVLPRAHLAQMRLITDALYDIRGDFTESDHGRCLRLLATRHRKRALLVVLTDFVDAETAGEMIAHLQRAARRHLVLLAALRDPFLGRAARERPGSPFEGFRKAAATELLNERRLVLERLRQMGAHVLDVDPGGLTPPLINRYLQITFRGQL